MSYANICKEELVGYTGTQRSVWKPELSNVVKRRERKSETTDGLWQVCYSSLFAQPHFILKRKDKDDMWQFVKNSTDVRDLLAIVESYYETESHA